MVSLKQRSRVFHKVMNIKIVFRISFGLLIDFYYNKEFLP